MKAYEGTYGFIASDPRLTYNDHGEPRLYIRIGINHFRRISDRQLERLPPTFHDLVQFGRAAELSAERFKKGDDFIAVGYTRTYARNHDGQAQEAEQFVAYRLSHDGNTTAYEVTRTRRAAERETPQLSQEHQAESASTSAAAQMSSPPSGNGLMR